jgi:hypothetical protein
MRQFDWIFRKVQGGVVEVYTHESSQVPLFKGLTEKKIRAGYDSVVSRPSRRALHQ